MGVIMIMPPLGDKIGLIASTVKDGIAFVLVGGEEEEEEVPSQQHHHTITVPSP